MKPLVAWIYDSDGWAYENRARGVAACLPQYQHRFCPHYGRPDLLPPQLQDADIIVCPDPRILPWVGASSKVILNLNAVKLFVRA